MCGIMGYVGNQSAAPLILEGLRKLEYRGYDSSGIAVVHDGKFVVERSKGKLTNLEAKIQGRELQGSVGLGHTRWATHGKPSDENAHPHRSERVIVVHNGIIENHLELRQELIEKGVSFLSETDTEIVPHFVDLYLREGMSFEKAVRQTLSRLQGAFALCFLSLTDPDKMILAKNSSPLILGIGNGENFIASDIPALLTHTRDVVILEDGDMAVLTKEKWLITDFLGQPRERKPRHITWSSVMAEKEGFKHFMLKEIHEQPRVLIDTLRGRLVESTQEVILDDIVFSSKEIAMIDRIVLVACGTSYHAALVGKFWLESHTQLPVEVDLGSEFRYRGPIVNSRTLFVSISQSGETADTLAALEEAKKGGARLLTVCNVVDSAIARRSEGVLYTHAGPEIGVASTKAFTTQLTALAILSLYLAREKNSIPHDYLRKQMHALMNLPQIAEQCLKSADPVAEIAARYCHAEHFLFLGRGSSYPIALEGALKLKEISYIHAEGYPGGEIKHGPIALIDENMPVVVLISGGATYPKMVSNLEEVRARGGNVIALITKGDDRIRKLTKDCMEIPLVDDFIRPMAEVIPLQLLAYYIADKRGTDVDQPRNLAKSVTVE